MEPDYYIRQGDSGVKISDVLKDENGAAVSIQGATVQFQVYPVGGGAALVSTTATNEQNGDGSDGTKGKVSYTWTGTNTTASGVFLGSWPVTFGGGAVQTYPNGGYILIDITPDPPTTAGKLYVQLAEAKSTLQLSGAFADADILRSLGAASRAVDEITGRRFYLDADASQKRYYSPSDPWTLDVDDIVTVTSLKTDDAGDGTFENTWTLNTDYTQEPLNAASDLEPWTRFCVHPLGTHLFPVGVPRSVEVTGKFGWPVVPDLVAEATTLLANRWLKRKREATFGVSGLGLDGSVVRIMSSDPDAKAMLEPLCRDVLVA